MLCPLGVDKQHSTTVNRHTFSSRFKHIVSSSSEMLPYIDSVVLPTGENRSRFMSSHAHHARGRTLEEFAPIETCFAPGDVAVNLLKY